MSEKVNQGTLERLAELGVLRDSSGLDVEPSGAATGLETPAAAAPFEAPATAAPFETPAAAPQTPAGMPPFPQPSAAESDLSDSEILRRQLERLNIPRQPRRAVNKVAPEAVKSPQASMEDIGFFPREPTSFEEANISPSLVEELVMKYLLARSDGTGRQVAEHVKMPFVMVELVLRRLKNDQFVYYRDSAAMNDYVYQLTDIGRQRARSFSDQCTYFGSVPVALNEYVESVTRQSIADQHPTEADLQRAFEDLLIEPRIMDRLGPAINSGRGLFLYGFPGNGKTSIAERITKSFGSYIWIPRTLFVDGEIVRLFDPMNHQECPLEKSSGLLDQNKIDRRWVRIARPTIVVGGELTMSMLEVTLNRDTGISEAPLQLKSNCGTLVIDDFGRQRMSTDELLNRWIVPLEKRFDFLNLASGKKLQVPFDQLIVFSTNLEPKDLVDDAFLRRIPYKIEVEDPSEENFQELFRIMCKVLKIEHKQDCIDYLIDQHYRAVNRPFRCCQPRDLLLQVKNYCKYKKVPCELTREYFDFAATNYFAVM